MVKETLKDIENYKMQDSIVRSKEKLIIIKENPIKFTNRKSKNKQ